MKDDRNRVNVEGRGTTSTETEELEALPSRSQPVLTQKSFVEYLATAIQSVVHYAVA